MVAPVRCGPVDRAHLDGHRAGDRQDGANGGRRLEGLVREQPVEADGDAETAERVQAQRDRGVGAVEASPPQRPDRHADPDERDHRDEEQAEAMLGETLAVQDGDALDARRLP